MDEMKAAAAVTAFILSLPLILSNFIYIKSLFGFTHFFLYSVICVYFICLSIFFLVLTLIFNNNFLKKISFIHIFFTSVLIIIFLLNAIIVIALHNNSGFILGANYNNFNSKKWQKADYNDTNQRKYMLKDLVKNILPNKNIDEVMYLLGKPHAANADGKTYYCYSENDNMIFRASNRDENGKIISHEFLDIYAVHQSELKKEIMIDYITGPAFMDHSTLNIYFDDKGIFKEYKLGFS